MKQEDVKRGREKGMEAAGESGAPKHQDEGTMIAFFDVETTVPFGSRRGGGGYSLLEFGAILVCPRRLIEVDNFSTLVRPSDLKSISSLSIRCNGITRDSVSTAPYFADVADKVFSFLHGRVWAGHNILRFDCPRIREAFAEIGRPPPEPMGIIDTLPLLTERFGRRAGDMKMATLANYFCLGPQKHRSLDDVRLNLEVLKYCAAVLFLESSVSNVPFIKKFVSGSIISENCNIQKGIPVGKNLKLRSPPVPYNSLEGSSCWVNDVREERLELGQSDNPLENEDATSLIAQVDQMKIDSSHLSLDASEGGGNSAPFSAANSADTISSISTMKKSSSYAGFLEPDDVLVNCITVSHTTLSPTVKRIQILHLNVPLYLCCGGLMIHFGISTKFTDHAGRPKFSILVNAPPSLCHVLAICDSFVQNSLRSHGSTSEWWPLMKKKAYTNSSTVRLHIRSKTNCESAAMYYTEIYRIDASKNINKLVLSKFDAAELDLLLTPGTTIDAFFCLDAYDYQQNAGIRLVAKSLVVHSSLPGS